MSWLNDAHGAARNSKREEAKARADAIDKAYRKHSFSQRWESAIISDLSTVGRLVWGCNLWDVLTFSKRFLIEPRFDSWIKHIKGRNYHEGHWEMYSSHSTQGTTFTVWIDHDVPCFLIHAHSRGRTADYSKRTESCDRKQLREALGEAAKVILKCNSYERS